MGNTTTSSSGAPSPGDDITDAYYAITAGDVLTHDQALLCLELLSEAGFMVVRPQSMLRMVDRALEATQ
jgi:hypothetical protein